MSAVETVMISQEIMQACFTSILIKAGFTEEKAARCASVFTNNSLDGVYTHGVNRFPRFVKYIMKGFVKPAAVPELKTSFGAVEQWDGNMGPGILNAMDATDRSMEIARQHGIGCVALSNTNHWMRAGTYGWQAARQGFVFIAWTNTIANMPAWGAADARLGNNPLVFALPYKEEAIVLDMAMSQYSLGAMELAAMKGEQMAVHAGFDKEGNLTADPGLILASRRLIPTGYWKGAGLALLLDILAAVLSNGSATHEIGKDKVEYGLSQVFISIDISRLQNHSFIPAIVNGIIEDYHGSIPADGSKKVLYPGERVLQTRAINSRNGIPVQKKVWDTILRLQENISDTDHIAYV